MLTMAGSKMATRVAPSLLKAAGAEGGLVVDSLEEYEERAVSLATDPEKLFEVPMCTICFIYTRLYFARMHNAFVRFAVLVYLDCGKLAGEMYRQASSAVGGLAGRTAAGEACGNDFR